MEVVAVGARRGRIANHTQRLLVCARTIQNRTRVVIYFDNRTKGRLNVRIVSIENRIARPKNYIYIRFFFRSFFFPRRSDFMLQFISSAAECMTYTQYSYTIACSSRVRWLKTYSSKNPKRRLNHRRKPRDSVFSHQVVVFRDRVK